ncbi:MAG: AI-2E family transporter [Candidatus Paceibacterota bacterium]
MSEKNYSLDISWSTILRIATVLVSLYFLYLIKDLVVWLIFAVIISILFEPAINYLKKKKIPRTMGAIIMYLGTFGLLSVLIYFTIPVFLSEIKDFSQYFPRYFNRISGPLSSLGFKAFKNFESFLGAINSTLEKAASSVFSGLFAVFGGIGSTVFTLSLAFFLSLEERPAEKTLQLIFPEEYEDFVLNIWERCRKKVTAWFGIRLLASLFVGILSYGAFLLFNVEYSLSLALLAGVLEIIPVLGPLITAVIAFMLVALSSPFKALLIVGFLVVIQEIEGHILTPVLSKKIMNLPPALILVALTVGAQLWGLMGAILTIPLLGILFEFIKDFLEKKKQIDAQKS